MKRILMKAGILAGVFILSVLIFSGMMNRKEVEKTKPMDSPQLPVLYMEEDGMAVNRMAGYRREIDAATERESLTLLPADRTLRLILEPCGCTVESITYELTSLEDGGLVENGLVKNPEDSGEDGRQSADFEIGTPIRMDQEYMLRFAVDVGEETPVYYYTRLLQRGGLEAGQYLEFVQNFSETCLNKEASGELSAYLEPDNTASNSSFYDVTIHSSLDQVTWGDLAPQMAQKGVPVLREANGTTVSITQDYVISAADTEGNTEYYTVSEFYRLRSSQNRIMLLDFERCAEQIFDGSLPVLTDTGLNLGVTGRDVEYVANRSADIVAFESCGDLWAYDRGANKVTRIFSFRDGDGSAEEADERTDSRSHGISVCEVEEETGDVSFLVYGYMSAGEHEGCTGVSVYRYSAERNVTEERVFIPVGQSYDVMAQSLDRLAFVSSRDELYLYLGNALYQVSLEDNTWTVLRDGIDDSCFAVSDSRKSVAWMEEMDAYGSSRLTFMSLETGQTMEIDAPAGEKIKALAFINEDLVYGLAKDSDILTDAAGNVTFGMYRICIRSISGEIVKDYQQDGIYITAVKQNNGLLELERAGRTETGFTPLSADHILNNARGEEDTVSVRLSVSERKGTQVILEFTSAGSTVNLLELTAQYLDTDQIPELELDLQKPDGELYYAYGKGKLQGIFSQVNEAVRTADEQVGVVLDSRQQYVWERGNTKSSVRLDPAQIPSTVLGAPLDEEILRQALGDGYEVLNLTGCTLENTYYQLSSGYPVIARTGAEETALIIGYDNYNIWIYDPATQEAVPMASDDAEALLAAQGNMFISYRESGTASGEGSPK
jgi:hypothetical protein